jgi:hypothetical protein
MGCQESDIAPSAIKASDDSYFESGCVLLVYKERDSILFLSYQVPVSGL